MVMKKKYFTTVALVCCFIMFLFFAGDLNGKWSGTLHAPDGNDYPLSYTLKIDGDKLTGTGASPSGPVELTNGKVTNGTDFAFNMEINGVDTKNTGKLYAEADSVGLDIDYNGMKMHATLKRDK